MTAADLIREAREAANWERDTYAMGGHAMLFELLADALEAALAVGDSTAPESAALTPTDRLAALIDSCVSDRETWHRAVDAVFGHAPEPAALSDEPTDAELVKMFSDAGGYMGSNVGMGAALRAFLVEARKHERGER